MFQEGFHLIRYIVYNVHTDMHIYIYTREIWEKDYSGEGQGGVWMHGGYSQLVQCMCEHASNSKLPLPSACWLGPVHVHSIMSCWSPLSLSDVDSDPCPGGDVGRSGRSEGNETVHV